MVVLACPERLCARARKPRSRCASPPPSIASCAGSASSCGAISSSQSSRCREAEALPQGACVAGLGRERIGAVRAGYQGVGGRVPQAGVDAVEYAVEAILAASEQSLQAEAEGLALNLQRIAGADGGDGVGQLQAGLEKRELAVVLDTVRAEAIRRQAERGDELRLEYSLKREIVYRLHSRGARAGGVAQVSGGKAGLPLVAMNHLRPPVERAGRAAEQCGDARQQAEAQRVVAPVAAGFVLIGSAGTVVHLGTVEREQRHAASHPALQQARRGKFRAGRDARNLAAVGQLPEHLAVARQQHPDIDPERRQRDGQGCADIAQAAGFHQGSAFRCGEQDAQWLGLRGCAGRGRSHGLGSQRGRKVRITRPILTGVQIRGPRFTLQRCR